MDPATRTAELFGDVGFGLGRWFGGVATRSGLIVGIPSGSEQALLIDPIARTTEVFGDAGCGQGKWHGGILTSDGSIVGIPFSADRVLLIAERPRRVMTLEACASSIDCKMHICCSNMAGNRVAELAADSGMLVGNARIVLLEQLIVAEESIEFVLLGGELLTSAHDVISLEELFGASRERSLPMSVA